MFVGRASFENSEDGSAFGGPNGASLTMTPNPGKERGVSVKPKLKIQHQRAGFVKGYSLGFGSVVIDQANPTEVGLLGMPGTLENIQEEENFQPQETRAPVNNNVASVNPIQARSTVKVSGKNSLQPSSRNRSNRAAIVSPEANSYESEYDEEYNDSDQSSSRSN
mgnify:CR=1 FL=1